MRRCIFVRLMVCLAFFFDGTANAVQEERLAAEFSDTIYPYFASEFKFGSFAGSANKKIHYAVKAAVREKAVIVFVTGRTEYFIKYAELLYDLKDRGFSFFIYDHRGQGSSDRILADPQKGHVVDFQNYVDDLKIFVDSIVTPQTDAPVFIVSHSMGGTISYQYVREHPERLKGLVLCAPMFSINTAPVPGVLADFVVKSMIFVGADERYIFGGGPYDPDKQFAGNDLTHSKVRFELNKRMILMFPQVALGSPTFGWLSQAFSAMDSSLNGDSHPENLPPILILSGTEDSVVTFAPQKKLCDSQASCRLQRISGARHELLMEKDEIRDTVIGLIMKFVEARFDESS